MQKQTTILILIIVIILLLVGGVYWWWGSQQPKEGKPRAGIPPDYIVVENTSEGQIVKNTKEGISMKVPEGWEVNKFVVDKDLEIRKFGPGQDIETELVDGIILDLYVKDEFKILDIKELIIKNIGYIPADMRIEEIDNISIAKEESKIGEDISSPFFKEDSKIIDIYFIKNKKLYHFSCTVAGSQYENYAQECEAIVKEKIKNNEF